MARSFDSVSYTLDVGRELVSAFESASRATTPGLIGGSRELPVRRKLKHLLPEGVGIGSGCVIDSFGGTSKQQDVVLYEQALCPVFSINETPETTYYPCEGVIAVGEVKSNVTAKELSDIFGKVRSVKELKRYARKSKSALGGEESVCFREYGNKGAIQGTLEEEFDQIKKPTDQIFGFAVAGSLGLSEETFCRKFSDLTSKTDDSVAVNLITFLDGRVVVPLVSDPKPTMTLSQQGADGFYLANKGDEAFQFLLSRLYSVYRRGRTVQVSAFERYITREGVANLPMNGTYIKLSQV